MSQRHCQIANQLIKKLLTYGRGETGEERCGLIGRTPTGEETWFPMENVRHSKAEYAIDDSELINFFKKSRKEGFSLYAIYHTHPAGPPHPSPRDVADSFYPDVFYIIHQLTPNESIRAYIIRDGRYEASGSLYSV